tara:strand:+ start:195 stop:521 length:327 start_codon:yes stop_codon:yes gene_type:complete
MANYTIEKNLPILIDPTAVNLNNVQYNVKEYTKDQETNKTIGITIQLTTVGMRILEENIRRASLTQSEGDHVFSFIADEMEGLIPLEEEYEPEAFDYVYKQLLQAIGY